MSDIIVERYLFEPLKSNMYMIIEGQQALIIDPCMLSEPYQKLRKKDIKRISIILTHEHFDHISGVPILDKEFRTHIIAHEKTGIRISDPHNHIASRYMATFIGKNAETIQLVKEQCKEQIVISVDTFFKQEYDYMWGSHSLHLVSTPGHSPGSICIILDSTYLFTGDSLIPGEPVITRFPGGNIDDYQDITLPFLHSLNREIIVYPGHGESMTLGEMI